MKKTLKFVKDVKPLEVIKIAGHEWEVESVIENHGPKTIVLELWSLANRKNRAVLTFADINFPVTVR